MNTENKVRIAKAVCYFVGFIASIYTAYAVGDFTYKVVAHYLVDKG